MLVKSASYSGADAVLRLPLLLTFGHFRGAEENEERGRVHVDYSRSLSFVLCFSNGCHAMLTAGFFDVSVGVQQVTI